MKQKLVWIKKHWKPLAGGGLALVLLAVAIGQWYFFRPTNTTQATKQARFTPVPTPRPATKASPLTGVMVKPDLAERPIRAVVIENHPDARPQSGLSQAGVVYEANAEGGITRFLAFFLEDSPPSLGPVRSLRTYFLSWGLEFNSPVAHAGGNADALDLVAPTGMKDLNALTSAQSGFFRTRDRYAPHNLYTDSARLDKLIAGFGFNQPAKFTVSPRKKDTPTKTPAHPNIHIDFSSAQYAVDYKYDPASNDYARFMAGSPHVDRNTGRQIHVKNVVVEMVPATPGFTRISGEQTVVMGEVGRGDGWVIRDGDAIKCTWVKDSRTSRTRLLDDKGEDIPLDAGNTWYSIVPTGKTVTL